MSDFSLSQILSGGFTFLTHLDQFNALKRRWQPVIAIVSPVVTILQEDKTLYGDTLDFLRVIAPAVFAPKTYTAQWVQVSLNAVMGTRLAVDGDIGDATKAVVRQFQSKYGLTVDGWAGTQTCAVLDAKVSALGLQGK